ncbi:hypothetical protein MMC07_008127 [Pseudocyphellaria aurata]|nr:hypothetical protein [Pseudocyphellaria aurata]
MANVRNAKGKRGRSGTKKISGVDFTWDPDLDDNKPAPAPLFPEYHPVPPTPLSKNEKIQIARFRTLRSNIHEGPLYTVIGDNIRVGKHTVPSGASFDPFEGMPTYSQKYTKRRRRLPKLDTRPYVFKFFPKELWSTLDPQSAIQRGAGTFQSGKKLQLSSLKRPDRLGGLDRDEGSGGEDGEEAVGQQNKDEDPTVRGGEEEEEEDELVDDEYEEDEDEGGDYNAEQYFDDGGDDVGDDYDGGEAEGGDFY